MLWARYVATNSVRIVRMMHVCMIHALEHVSGRARGQTARVVPSTRGSVNDVK